MRLHKLHQRSSKTNAAITTVLSQEIARMKVADFDFPTQCLDIFDTKLKKFNEISTVDLVDPMAVSFLKSTIQGNTALLSAWANYKTIRANMFTGTIPTYDQYFEYLMEHSKQLEVAITDNKTSCKANVAEFGYEMLPYSPSNKFYDEADVLSSFMVDRGGDVDMIHDSLQCNKALKLRLPRPPPRTRRELSPKELQIRNPGWQKLKKETKRAWIQEDDNNKKIIISQFVVDSKSDAPIIKNQSLRIAYNIQSADNDIFDSDFTASSEGIFKCTANSAMFDSTTDDDSNGKSVLEGNKLNVNAAAVPRKPKKRILKGKGKKLFKQSEMPVGEVSKTIASEQIMY